MESRIRFEATGSSARTGSIVKFTWTLPRPSVGLDLTNVKVARQGALIFLYAEVGDKEFAPWKGTTAVIFYIQTIFGSQGYPIAGIFANFLVRVSISSGQVRAGELLWYFDSGPGSPARGWQFIGGVPAAGSGGAVEARISSSALLIAGEAKIRVTCVIAFSGTALDSLDEPVGI